MVWRTTAVQLPGPVFELEDGQQGREGGEHKEDGQTEVIAERSSSVVKEWQRDEKRHKQYFQPHCHCRSQCSSFFVGSRSIRSRAQLHFKMETTVGDRDRSLVLQRHNIITKYTVPTCLTIIGRHNDCGSDY